MGRYLNFVINPINMPGWCWRHRHRGIGRPPKPIRIASSPLAHRLVPIPGGGAEPIRLDPAEVEAMRLVDLEGLSFEGAGERMGVSRNTAWRLVDGARRKLITAIIEGREVLIG
jgi:predicted DNA-binding protein (UPF0251 family)